MSAVIRIDKNKDLVRWPDFEADVTSDNPIHAGSLVFEYAIQGEASVRSGVWQCDPCTLKVSQTTNEICVLIEGVASITDEKTGRIEQFEAGEGFLLCKGSNIVWAIEKAIKKYYITIAD
ncbi:cupin domain-containing protein [Pseudomonas fluorescens]|uniref:cupin domain-containing protein n=1 Tax=Pseudomonas fluorescens TaxID=294 RepID=UPI0010E56A0B|nr:cupin domain-containing protein [Pseudomonas fluorescens]TCV66178.1 putative cupin superfamily protein [Pseudomonas fluorescens]